LRNWSQKKKKKRRRKRKINRVQSTPAALQNWVKKKGKTKKSTKSKAHRQPCEIGLHLGDTCLVGAWQHGIPRQRPSG